MDHCVRYFKKVTGCSLAEAIYCATARPGTHFHLISYLFVGDGIRSTNNHQKHLQALALLLIPLQKS